MIARSERVSAPVRAHAVAAFEAAGLPLMSHDDRTEAHVQQSADEGIAIAEFPTSIEAAKEAKRLGLATIAGAPNYMRGGSQSGNVNVIDLLEADLVDILASDYVPRSMLDAVFVMAGDKALPQDLPQLVQMVTSTPANAAGLQDRGQLATGLNADLIRVRPHGRTAHVISVWRNGRQVA